MARRLHTGFTLIEMMITLVVLAVLVQVVAPGFQKIIKDNRVKSEVYGLRAALSLARSEAATSRRPVVVCSSVDGTDCNVAADGFDWAKGYIAFVDGGDAPDSSYTVPGATELDGDRLITVNHGEAVEYLEILYTNISSNTEVDFNSQGYAIGSNGSFKFCDDRGDTYARGLILSAIGSLRAAIDSGDDEIMEDHNGDNFDCTP